ncbi:MAG TPA: M50 family metallopeptidase [Candidatus Limnocylindrales bacterium]|nr:M50 family metallopeptidase [Candidatus Limnocylindrales bacterium]
MMNLPSLTELWRQLTAIQEAPEPALIAATAVVAAMAVGVNAVWRVTRTVITITHEGGHALVAVLSGRRLRGIRLHSDTSGLTLSRGKPRGLGMVLSLFAGYVAPSLLGLAAVALLAAGRVTLLLWLALLLLLAVLLMIRNWYGLLAVAVTGAVVYAVSRYAAATTQTLVAYAAVWFLLLGGVRPVLELRRRRRGRGIQSDPDQLAQLTPVPAWMWTLLFGLINLVCLGYGGYLLLRAATG